MLAITKLFRYLRSSYGKNHNMVENLTKLLWSLVDYDAARKFKYKTHCLLLVKSRECKTIPFAFCLTSPLKQIKIILDLGGKTGV